MVLQKLIALRYGPAGVLELGQFILIQGLCYGLLTDGLNRAMMVQAGQQATAAQRHAVLVKGGLAGLFWLFITSGALIWAMPTLLPGMVDLALPLAVAVGGAGWFFWVTAVLVFEGKPWAVFWLTTLQAIVLVLAGAVPSAGLGWQDASPPYDLQARLLLLGAGQAMLALAAGAWYLLHYHRQAGPGWRAATGLLKPLGAFGVFSLAVMLAGRGADMALRAYAMDLGLYEPMGYFQAAVRLGDIMLVPFTSLFAGLFFAQATQVAVADLRQALGHQLRLAWIGVGMAALLWATSPWVLPMLNRADFTAAVPYFARQVPGDMLRILTLPISVALMAAGRLRALAWLEGLSLLVYLLAAAGLGSWLGPLGLSWAHTARYVIFGAATCWAARDLLPFALPGQQPSAHG